MRKVLSILLVIIVLGLKVGAFSAERKSKLFIYNSSYDLMRGDLWDFIKDQQILVDLESYPRNFVVIGLGNTNQSYSIGEMIAMGTVGLPRFLWISPQYPYKVVEIWDKEFPFAAIAVCNPKGEIQWEETNGEIHKTLSDRIEEEGIKVAALKMRGILFDVQFHVSSHIPKEGIRTPHDARDEGQRNKAFRIEGPSEWELNGTLVMKDKGTRHSGSRDHPNGSSMGSISTPRNYSSWHLPMDNPFASMAMERIHKKVGLLTPH